MQGAQVSVPREAAKWWGHVLHGSVKPLHQRKFTSGKKKCTLEGEQIAGPILLYEQLCCHGTINPFKIGQWEQGCGSRLLARGRD